MPFRSDSEQMREQLRRAEEKLEDLEKEAVTLRAQAEADRREMVTLRRSAAARRYGLGLALIAVGVAFGLAVSGFRAQQAIAKVEALSALELARAHQQREQEVAALAASLAQAREGHRACEARAAQPPWGREDPAGAIRVDITSGRVPSDTASEAMRVAIAKCLAKVPGAQGGISGGGTTLSASERECIKDAARRAKTP